jgi:hypothetical protein
MTIDNIITYIALIASIVAIYKGFHEGKKAIYSGEKDRADAFVTYEEYVKKSAENSANWSKRYDELEEKYNTLEKKYNIESKEWSDRYSLLACQMSSLIRSNEDIKDWAERLVHQVESLGKIPVKIRTRSIPSANEG